MSIYVCYLCDNAPAQNDLLCEAHRTLVDSIPQPHAFVDLTLSERDATL